MASQEKLKQILRQLDFLTELFKEKSADAENLLIFKKLLEIRVEVLNLLVPIKPVKRKKAVPVQKNISPHKIIPSQGIDWDNAEFRKRWILNFIFKNDTVSAKDIMENGYRFSERSLRRNLVELAQKKAIKFTWKDGTKFYKKA